MKFVLRASGGTSTPFRIEVVHTNPADPPDGIRRAFVDVDELNDIASHVADVVERERQVIRQLVLHAGAVCPQIRHQAVAIDRRLVVDEPAGVDAISRGPGDTSDRPRPIDGQAVVADWRLQAPRIELIGRNHARLRRDARLGPCRRRTSAQSPPRSERLRTFSWWSW